MYDSSKDIDMDENTSIVDWLRISNMTKKNKRNNIPVFEKE